MNSPRHLRASLRLLILAAGLLGAGRLDAEALSTSTTETISTGTGWRLIDADPTSRGGSNTLLWEVSPAGVANLPVSQAQKDLLLEAFSELPPTASDSNLIYFSQEMLQALEQPTFPAGYEQYADEPLNEKSLGCSWKTETRNRSWPFSKNLLDKSYPFSGGIFSGSLDIDLPISGQFQIAATYKIHKCFGVPIGFRFESATASGTASISGSGALSVTANAGDTWEKEWLVDDPKLGEVSFSIGPVPIRLVFTLPIYVGAKLDAQFSAQVSASLDASATGSFTYTCTPDDCTGTNDFTDQFEFTGPTASATVDLGAQAHARVMLRLSLYDDEFAFVEGGLKAYAKTGIWGYLGNACGDADGDGNNETVRALVGDLSWGYQLAYGWGGWALPDRLRFTSPHDYYLGWRDLLGPGASTALQPMILGPSSVAEGATATYTVKMRPCYKYANAVNLTMAPGTWTGGTTVTPPTGSTTFSRTFSSSGNQTLVATAVSDTFGRNLSIPYSRTITVTSNTPTAPSGLTATALSSSAVRLIWADNSNNETQFEIHRRTLPSGTFATVATVGANTTQVTDSVQASTSYEYRVRALNGTDGSGFSNLATVTTPSAGPAAPSGLSGTYNASTHRFTLSWTDNSANEQGFTLQFSVSGSAFSDLSNLGANVASYTSAANPPLGPYQFRVRSYNGLGTSAWSNTFSLMVINPSPTTSIAWIQKAETSWGPAGTLTAAGYAANGTGTVQLWWRERSTQGIWGAWSAVAYQATPAADTTWSNTISSGSPTNSCHWFDAYTVYSGVTSAVFHFTGSPDCP